MSERALGMKSYLSTVEEVFEITGRGLVVSPGIPCDCESIVRIGDRLELVRPDDSLLSTDIEGIEHIHTSAPVPHQFYPIRLSPTLRKEDVPIGTKLFIQRAQ